MTRTPGFTATGILVMALGIGANVALFTVVHSVLMKPLPFRDPGRLMDISEIDTHSATRTHLLVPNADFFDWHTESHGFEAIALEAGRAYNLSVTSRERP